MNSSGSMLFANYLCCPACRGALNDHCCSVCDRPFTRSGDQWRFVTRSPNSADAAFQAETFTGSTWKGRLFNAGKRLVSSEYQWRNHLNELLSEYSESSTIVELGSGARRLRRGIINVDLFPFPNVDITADISAVPLRSEIADCIILDSVIEHVADPSAVVGEAHRILKEGGRLLINCPFMLPYHGYPNHFQNFTRDGLLYLLRHFSSCKVQTTFGPATAWVNMTAESFAVLLAGERGAGYVAAKAFALLPIFWLKYFDVFFGRTERSHRIAGMLCAVATR
jgi:SAM-dependent methyltransferase